MIYRSFLRTSKRVGIKRPYKVPPPNAGEPYTTGVAISRWLRGGALLRTPRLSRKLIRVMIDNTQSIHGACHCGGVRFQVTLADGLRTARRCNCSYCAMRGAVAVSVDLADVDILQGEHLLTLYQFNTNTARHYFCSRCGIYTHHQRRSNPRQYGVNVACLEGLSPFDFAEIPVTDGVTHLKDRPDGQRPARVGVLRFIPTSKDDPDRPGHESLENIPYCTQNARCPIWKPRLCSRRRAFGLGMAGRDAASITRPALPADARDRAGQDHSRVAAQSRDARIKSLGACPRPVRTASGLHQGFPRPRPRRR